MLSFSKIEQCPKKTALFILLIGMSIPVLSTRVFAGPASSNYELKEYGFGAGGDTVSSDHYSLLGTAGESEALRLSSANFRSGNGLIFTLQSNVPPAPAFTNPANYYNKLKLIVSIGGNPSDTQFAIAISTDAFATDTRYVETDHTPGATPLWQPYTAWGGAAGFNVVGLLPNQTYTVKVAARQGNYTQVQYGPTAAAATDYPSITFSVSGVPTGTTIDGMTTDVTTTGTAVSFGELPFNTVQEAASLLTVTTTADLGYTVTADQTDDLQTYNNIIFPRVSGTNAVPSAWPGTVTTGAYGYHSSDHSLGTGNTTRFTNGNTYAQFETTPREVAYNGGPINPDNTYIIYSIETGKGQPAGSYSHTITYIATGVF